MERILIVVALLIRLNVTWTLDESKCDVRLENAEDQKSFCSETNPDAVKYLYFKTGKLSTIKVGSFSNFPNVAKIYLNGTRVEAIQDGAFKETRVLEELHLNDNNISTLNGPFFNLENLIILDLSRNNLSELDPDVFNGLQKIEKLFINHNKLTNLNLRFSKQLSSRVSLDSSYNEITSVHLDNNLGIAQMTTFSGILEYVNLSRNKIASLTTDSFSAGYDLENLDLSYNSISDIDYAVFADLKQLKRLNLSNNRLSILKANMFLGLSNLKELSVKNNLLSAIENSSFNFLLIKLKVIDLSGNRLKNILFNLFSQLTDLRVLNLSNNAINSVSDFDFKSLEVLDLSQNRLSKVDSVNVARMMNIKKIILHHNELTKISMTTPHNFNVRSLDLLLDISFNKATGINTPDIKTLNISNNQYSGAIRFGDTFVDSSNNKLIQFVVTSEETEFVNVSYNLIEQLESSFFTKATNLKELHVNNNLLSRIEKNAFSYTRKLKILNLSRNRLSDLQVGTLDELTELEVLDVSNNNFVYLYKLSPSNFNSFSFNRFGHLRTIAANNNPWSCSIFKDLNGSLKKPACIYYPIDAKDFESTAPPREVPFTTEIVQITQQDSEITTHAPDLIRYLEMELADINDKLAKIMSSNEKMQISSKDFENRLRGFNSDQRFETNLLEINSKLAKYNSINDKFIEINNRLTEIINFQNAYNNLQIVDNSNDFLAIIVIISVILTLLLIIISLLFKLISNNKNNKISITNY